MNNVNQHLITLGHAHEHVTADWEDHGGPESGPMVDGRAAFDVYASDTDYVYIEEDGQAHYEKRDLKHEAYIAEHFC